MLCTAHTQNDQLETVLMRFLQGSPAEAAAGIREWREINGNSNAGIYARPLLCVTRKEIEEYVASPIMVLNLRLNVTQQTGLFTHCC